MDDLARIDPEIYAVIERELQRQLQKLEMIASENFVSAAVLQAQGSILTHKYAEGYPGRRFYGGCEFVDTAENSGLEPGEGAFRGRLSPTSSPIPAPRPTWPSIFPSSSRATPSWAWTWPMAAT